MKTYKKSVLAASIAQHFADKATAGLAPSDTLSQIESALDATNTFLMASGIISDASGQLTVHGDDIAVTPDHIETLLATTGVAEADLQSAALSISTLVEGSAGKTGNAAISSFLANGVSDDEISSMVALDSYMPATLAQQFTNVSTNMDSFGKNTDSVTADLRVAITIAALRWTSSFTPSLLHVVSSTRTIIEIVRPEYSVFNLGDSSIAKTSNLALCRNPAPVINELTRAIPQDTHADVDITGYLKLGGKAINLYTVSMDGSYGNTDFNHTDEMSDPVQIEDVHLTITDTGPATDVIETFSLPTMDQGIATREGSNALTTARTLIIDKTLSLSATSENIAGPTASIADLLSIVAGSRLQLRVRITFQTDIASWITTSYGEVTYSFTKADGSPLDPADETSLHDMFAAEYDVTILGYKPRALYSQENQRKSAIISTQNIRVLKYHVPQAPQIGADRPIGADVANAVNQQIANLRRLSSLGTDATNYKAICGLFDTVVDARTAFTANKFTNRDPGLDYAAGGLVEPVIIERDLNVEHLQALDDTAMRLALRARVDTIFLDAVADMSTISLIRNEMPRGSKLRLRAVCSGEILTKILSAGGKVYTGTDGLQYSFSLEDGTIVDVVTSDFEDMGNEIKCIPYVVGAPASYLNFGRVHNNGSLVVSYQAVSGTGTFERMMYSVREVLVPLNVIGLRISVQHIENIRLEV